MAQEQKTPDMKQIESSQKHYNEDGFWEKVREVAKKAGLKVIYLALLLYYTASADTTDIKQKAMIYGGLGYFILPIDLIPDAIPLIGFTDDLAALVAVAKGVMESITPEIRQQAIDKLKEWFGDFDQKEIQNLF